MRPRVYLLTEIKRLLHYYNVRYVYNASGITIMRDQVLPPLKFSFDQEYFYVSVKHLPVSDFDPLNWKFTYMMPATCQLIKFFKKLLRFNLIDDGTFNSISSFERARHSKYYQRSGVESHIENNNSLRAAS